MDASACRLAVLPTSLAADQDGKRRSRLSTLETTELIMKKTDVRSSKLSSATTTAAKEFSGPGGALTPRRNYLTASWQDNRQTRTLIKTVLSCDGRLLIKAARHYDLLRATAPSTGRPGRVLARCRAMAGEVQKQLDYMNFLNTADMKLVLRASLSPNLKNSQISTSSSFAPSTRKRRRRYTVIRMMTLRLLVCSATQDDPPPAGLQCSAR